MSHYATIAPSGSNQKVAFKRFLDGGYAAIGWLPEFDLTGKSLAEVHALIEQNIQEETVLNDKNEQVVISALKNQNKAKRNFTNFLSLKPGMIVVVPNVQYGLHGLGRITSGYKYQKDKHDSTGNGNDNYSHFYDVEWIPVSSTELTKDLLLLEGEKNWPPRGGPCSSIQEGEWLTRLLHKLEPAATVIVVTPLAPPDEEDEDLEVEAAVEEETKPYSGDSFTTDEDGHFVGDDGFVVPRDFGEFYMKYPEYTRRWVMKRIHRISVDMDVEDWEADLLMHLRYLPPSSKYRQPGSHRWHPEGCEDVIQIFDPILQYGASARRFFNYVKNCLSNRYSTIYSKQSKNPICTMGNLVLGMPAEEYSEVVDDEYVHHHCVQPFKPVSEDVKIFLEEYRCFVNKTDPELLEVMAAIAQAGNYREAMEDMSMTEQEFNRARNRMRVLKDCFLKGSTVPKQRKPYKKREVTTNVTIETVDDLTICLESVV